MADQGNLFTNSSPPGAGERAEVLLEQRNLVVERIVSSANLVPTTYKQPQDEWVVLLRGEARLRVAGVPIELRTGDYLFLPAGTEHTVEGTSEGALWLAVHLHPQATPP
jgi:cupin 2 domain-containing protein